MQLVYLSPVPWASFAQRPQKFVEWFHARTGGRVLWIDPYPTRFPSLADLRRFGTTVREPSQTLPPWLSVVRPTALPIEPLPGSGLVNGERWRHVLHAVSLFASQKHTLVGIGKPSVLALKVLKLLKGCRSVYDAMDDFPSFYTGFSRWAMRRREHSVVCRVTDMLTSSTVLKQRWGACRADIQLVHNGLDAGMLPVPRASRRVSEGGKILGYVGTIATWFDWDWVIALANARQQDMVCLIGPIFNEPPHDLPQNIKLLPACEHRIALSSMRDFDVGLIPFKKNRLTASVDPIKYYEYRALGVPVISTLFGEMIGRVNEPGVFFLESGSNFINQVVENSFAYKPVDDQIDNFKKCNSWEVRFDASNILKNSF